MTNSNIDTREIVRLYVVDELTVREIASRLGLSYGKVYGILRNRVVMRRSNNGGPGRTMDHLKVAEIMKERIVTGDWRPNRRILPQQDLAKIFDVRNQVIRDAIAHLRTRGYLMTVPSKGNYVTPPENWS